MKAPLPKRLLPAFSCSWLLHAAPLPVKIESRALADQVSQSPEHFIIAAVDNEPAAFMAGPQHSARLRRDRSYGPSTAARQLMRSLENDYGLHEVSAWPIEPLHMHCAVLEVPKGGDRAALLAAWRPIAASSWRTPAEFRHAHRRLQRSVCRAAARLSANGCRRRAPWSRGEGVKVAIIRYRRRYSSSRSAGKCCGRGEFCRRG